MRTVVPRHVVGAAALVLVAYLGVFMTMPKHVFWSPDEGGKLLELSSMHWHGGLIYRAPYPGQRIDPGRRFYPRLAGGRAFPYPLTESDGRVVFHWPIWFPLLSGLMLQAFGITGIYIIPLLGGWGLALISGWIAHAIRPRLAAPAVLLVGLATPICFYSQTFWEHTGASLLAMIAVGLMLAAPPRSWRALAAIVPLLVAALMLRIEMAAFVIAALVTWGWRPRGLGECGAATTPPARGLPRWIVLAVTASVVAAMLYLFQRYLPAREFGFLTKVPWRLRALAQLPSLLPRGVISVLVNGGSDNSPIADPRVAALTALAIIVCGVVPLLASTGAEVLLLLPSLLLILGFSTWLAFLGKPYRALHSLFPLAPFTVLWMYGWAAARRRADLVVLRLSRLTALYLVGGSAILILFYAGTDGGLMVGLEWGQRYLLTLYPLLAILSLAGLDAYRASARPRALTAVVTAVAAAMVLISVQLEVRGLVMLRVCRVAFAQWDAALRRDGPVVTDVWWLPVSVAPLYLTHEIYLVDSPAQLAEWVPLATAHGTSRFTFASLGPLDPAALGAAGAQRLADDDVVEGLHFARLAVAERDPASVP